MERKSHCSRDVFSRGLADSGSEYLAAGIPWLTFNALNRRCRVGSDDDCALQVTETDDLFSTKAEQCSLLSPVGRQMCCQPHQFLGIELRRLPTIDDRGGDVGCEPRKAQQG